ncbi:MAG TPA: sigma-70 family RNA polymerase sigma factor [Planctomycetaceae bacterium]|nr:RNA polymerase subunit sigma-70 [Blastopirellula sp.]HAY78310.1 sigma-70 family RNA polymerase sigma factor [Planctomycetaceae bacterium]
MALSDLDRELLERCLARKPQSWEAFVDRFLGLVVHVVNHSAEARGVSITAEDREDLVADIFCAVIHDDLAILRRFRGHSSLATYLTVIARRVVVRELVKRRPVASSSAAQDVATSASPSAGREQRIDSREEVERLLSRLNGKEADVVRMYHLEGKSYSEISTRVGMAENSIGPTLSRARAKMRHGRTESVG